MADDTDEVIQSVRETENDLLHGAFEPPAKEPAAEAPPSPEPAPAREEAPGEEPAGTTRTRDPSTGRFASTKGQQPAPEGEQPQRSAEDEHVLPTWRAREINDERRAVAAENERLRVENARLMGMRAQQERAQPQEPQKPDPLPDPLLDPEGFYKRVREDARNELVGQMAHDRLNFNLEMASMRYGERFEKAFEAVIQVCQSGHPHFARQFVSQANPGAAIMDWYNRVQRDQRIGPDVDAYEKKQRETLLDDDAFFEEMQARRRDRALNGGAPPGSQPGKPNTVVRMPPSLSKATGSSEQPMTATDGSEEALFAHAMAPKRRG